MTTHSIASHAATATAAERADAFEAALQADARARRVERAADWLLTAMESENFPPFSGKGALVKWAFIRVTERAGRALRPEERGIVLDAARSLYPAFGFGSATAPVEMSEPTAAMPQELAA